MNIKEFLREHDPQDLMDLIVTARTTRAAYYDCAADDRSECPEYQKQLKVWEDHLNRLGIDFENESFLSFLKDLQEG